MTSVWSAGLWGLVARSGAPACAPSARQLGLAQASDGYVAEARDSQDPDCLHQHRGPAGHTILAGWIAGKADVARRLNLAAETPAVQLAQAALQQFGAETPAELLGEWSLFHRDPEGTVWLMLSAAQRDRLFVAMSAEGLAFAPDAVALSGLGGVDGALDPEGVLTRLARHKLKSRMGWRSMFRGIEKVPPGGSIRITPDGEAKRHVANALTLLPTFEGDVDDALSELDGLLRQILRERLCNASRPAILLSGGLDSSLIAGLSARELAVPPMAVCSVSPPGSGIADEYSYADAVAIMHGISLFPAYPDPSANPYCPAEAIMAGGDGPLISNRHCLTTSFHHVAREQGASLLVNGTYGEMSVTARLPGDRGLRGRLGNIRHALREHFQPPQDEFNMRIAPELLKGLGSRIAGLPLAPPPPPRASGQIGYLAGAGKALAQPNAYYPGALRMDFPYRDLRLLRLFARLPRSMVPALGADRGAARTIGRAVLPETVRQRRAGMPADPGHFARLQAFAGQARGRVADFRAAGLDEWLDLVWLERTLGEVAQHGVRDYAIANHVQLTALAGEYFLWLQARTR